MSKTPRVPSTPALRLLREAGVDHTVRTYRYIERGGARASAAALGVDLHAVIKTLVLEDEDKQPLLVLMHGDREVSTKRLARQIGCRAIAPCAPAVAERHTGYRVGGTSPFGIRRPMKIYVESSILALPVITINGGARGVLVDIDPHVLVEMLGAIPVEVAG